VAKFLARGEGVMMVLPRLLCGVFNRSVAVVALPDSSKPFEEAPFNTDSAGMPVLGGCTVTSEIVEFSDPGFAIAESNFAANWMPKAGK
jgi:hypothetical protein